MKRMIGVLAAGLLSLAAAAAAAPTAGADVFTDIFPGALDHRFGTNGIASVPAVADDFDRYFDVAVDLGGRAYAVGTARKGTEGYFALTRILPNGTADPSFGSGGTALLDIAPGSATENARGVGLQLNGKIIVSGQARSLEPGADPADIDIYVARFNRNGTLDTSFANGGTLRINLSDGAQVTPTTFRADQTYGLAVAPNGKIILVSARGADSERPGKTDSDFAIIRLTRNGALDPTWNGDGIAIVDTVGPANPTDDANGTTRSLNDNPRQAIIEPNGRVVVGAYASGEGRAKPRVMRFLPNGALDQSFGAGGIATVPRDNFFHPNGGPDSVMEVYDIARQGSSYIMCGYGRGSPDTAVDAISARFGPTGQVDPTYGTNGAVAIDLAGEEDRCRDLEVLGDSRVLLSGSGTPVGQTSPRNIDAMLVALDRNGKPINGFGPNGVQTFDFGGNSDSVYGIARTIDATRAIAVGFKGNTGTPTAGVADDGRALRYVSLRRP